MDLFGFLLCADFDIDGTSSDDDDDDDDVRDMF